MFRRLNSLLQSAKVLPVVFPLAMAGCAHLDSFTPVTSSADVSHDKAYLYGNLACGGDGWLVALGFTEEKTGRHLVLSTRYDDPIYAVVLDPGRYDLTELMLTARGSAGIMTTADVDRIELPPGTMKPYVNVEPGMAYYIGDFIAEVGEGLKGSQIEHNWSSSDSSQYRIRNTLYTQTWTTRGKAGAKIREARCNYDQTTTHLKTLYPELTDVPTKDSCMIFTHDNESGVNLKS